MSGFEGPLGKAYAVMETDGIITSTSQQQIECERTCELSFLPLRPGELDEEDMEGFRAQGIINETGEPVLMRDKHAAYLTRGLAGLGSGFISLDAGRPWLVYWILHSLDLLDRFPSTGDIPKRAVRTLSACQDRLKGGFGGGPQQLPHCAPMYASVLSLLIVGTPSAYSAIDRNRLYRFFVSLKHPSGGFRMHDDGEVDARGTYTVIAVASLLNMLTPELSDGVVDFSLRCQTYEGGFGGEPWNEAHGGYTFCAFASLVILGQAHRADLDGLRRWLASRQMRAEGGFQGRTNKLVDGCYSFWQGGAVALLDYVRAGRQAEVSHRDQDGRVVLQVAENTVIPPSLGGTAADTTSDTVSPSNTRRTTANATAAAAAGVTPTDSSALDNADADMTEGLNGMEANHSGVSAGVERGVGGAGGRASYGDGLEFDRAALQEYVLMCAQQSDGGLRDKPGKSRDFYHTCYTLSGLSVAQHCLAERPIVVGDMSNTLKPTNAAFNIAEDKVVQAMKHFEELPHDHVTLMGVGSR